MSKKEVFKSLVASGHKRSEVAVLMNLMTDQDVPTVMDFIQNSEGFEFTDLLSCLSEI